MKLRNTNRSRSYYRHQRERAINRKIYIFHHIWGNELTEYKNVKEIPLRVGKWSKGKVHCSCKICKYEKHYKIEKAKYKEKKRVMKEEINEYLQQS